MIIVSARSTRGVAAAEIGAESRGKYTFESRPALLRMLPAVPVSAELTYVHGRSPRAKSGYGMPFPGPIPARPPKMTENRIIEARGRKIAQNGPRYVCLYRPLKSRHRNENRSSR